MKIGLHILLVLLLINASVKAQTNIEIQTNHTEGVAPLSVSFDLTNSAFAFENGLMLSEFIWDFGDQDDEYNIGKGYCPSHVYREPGEYTAKVSAWYDNKLIASTTVQINVSEFSGTTYYISADGSDSNDGLTQSSAFATPAYAFNNFTHENVRFLLRQGDTLRQSSGIILGRHGDEVYTGTLIVSSYKDENNPSDNKPVIYDTRDDDRYSAIITMLNVYDYRFVNIKLQGAGGDINTRNRDKNYPSGFVQSSVTPSEYCLFLDCDVQGCGSNSFKIEGKYHVVQGCSVRDGGSYGVFSTEGINCAYIGVSMKDFTNDRPEYTMRLSTHIVGNYVAYCDLWGDYTKCTFQIRGDESSYNYVWRNQFDRFAGINQTNNEQDETLHHNTFDANIAVMREYEGNTTGTYDRCGLFISSNNAMIRNNIVYGFDAGFYVNTHDIVGGCSDLWYYNNTVIALRENSYFIAVNKDAKHVNIKNNIFYNLAETSGYSDRFINVVTEYPDLATDLSQITSDNNVFFGKGWDAESTQRILNVAFYDPDPTLAVWRADFNNGKSSLFADALLNTSMDVNDPITSLEIGFANFDSASPAINAGDTSQVYTKFDYFGNERSDLTVGAIAKKNLVTTGNGALTSSYLHSGNLYQNYPNPVHTFTEIKYIVKQKKTVSLKIFNIAGQEVATLINNEAHLPGVYNIRYDASNTKAGIYFYELKLGNKLTSIKKMIVVK